MSMWITLMAQVSCYCLRVIDTSCIDHAPLIQPLRLPLTFRVSRRIIFPFHLAPSAFYPGSTSHWSLNCGQGCYTLIFDFVPHTHRERRSSGARLPRSGHSPYLTSTRQHCAFDVVSSGENAASMADKKDKKLIELGPMEQILIVLGIMVFGKFGQRPAPF